MQAVRHSLVAATALEIGTRKLLLQYSVFFLLNQKQQNGKQIDFIM
jgi:hypothetical protein